MDLEGVLCPHCRRGKLTKSPVGITSHDWVCFGGCRRGFKEINGNLHEIFAGTCVYSPSGDILDLAHFSQEGAE